LHLCAIVLFAWTGALVFGPLSLGLRSDALSAAWLACGAAALALGAFAFLPPRFWAALARHTGATWAGALGLGLLAAGFDAYGAMLWRPSAALTFRLVALLLQPFLTGVIADPARHIIGTEAFNIEIGATCSGVEGVALMLGFSALWLWVFRRSCRFPRALLLAPAGMILIWTLNGVRIAALILIGNAGARDLAAGGFHSQAGWIAFNAVAFAFAMSARKIRWLAAPASSHAAAPVEPADPNAAYLAPLLAILVAAMVARASTTRLELVYPIQLLAGAAAFWLFRREYRRMDWSMSLSAPLFGAAAGAVWLACDRLIPGPRLLAPAEGTASLLCGALAAVTLIPAAEELAFRGFLPRRLVSAAFLSVPPKAVGLIPLLVSTLAFSFYHAVHWLAAALAGSLYAAAFLRRGRTSDAVAAHAFANLLLVICAALTGRSLFATLW